MREALETLPCVEASSVEVDFQTKEARFTVKKDSTCDLEAIKKVMKDAGFTVSLLSADDKVHEATVVKAGDAKITLTMKGDDKQHTHDVAKDAEITLDGKAVKLEALKEGVPVKVTMDDKSVVTKIEARAKSDGEYVLTVQGMT